MIFQDCPIIMEAVHVTTDPQAFTAQQKL